MTTDTALGVTRRVVEDGLMLGLKGTEGEADAGKGSLTWVDHPELKFGKGESVSLSSDDAPATWCDTKTVKVRHEASRRPLLEWAGMNLRLYAHQHRSGVQRILWLPAIRIHYARAHYRCTAYADSFRPSTS